VNRVQNWTPIEGQFWKLFDRSWWLKRFDHVTSNRFRHGTKLLRWRPHKISIPIHFRATDLKIIVDLQFHCGLIVQSEQV
jgi:hypothetical protein